jgi:hypothetical protein
MVSVGVTGHRVLAEIDKLEAGIDGALAEIERQFGGEPLTIVSALAEGADRLAAEAVLRRPSGRLEVVLPFPQAEYERDFEEPASLAAFRQLLAQADRVVELPTRSVDGDGRADAYLAGGQYLLDHCDVILAVWDGQGAQGRGGTGNIVELAKGKGLPVAWVHAGNRQPGTMTPTSLGPEQGLVTYESLPPAAPSSAPDSSG